MQEMKFQDGGGAAADRIEGAASGLDNVKATLLAMRKRADQTGSLAKKLLASVDADLALWALIAQLAAASERKIDGWATMIRAQQDEAARHAPLSGFGSPQDRDVSVAAANREIVTRAQTQAAQEVVGEMRKQLDARARKCVDALADAQSAYEAEVERYLGPGALLDVDLTDLHRDGVFEAWLRSRPAPVTEAFTRWRNAVERGDEKEATAILRASLPIVDQFRQKPEGALVKVYGAIKPQVIERERTSAFKFFAAVEDHKRKNIPDALVVAARMLNGLLELHCLLLGEHAAFLSPIEFERMLNDDSRVPKPALYVDDRWPFRFIAPSKFTVFRTG